MHKLLPDIMPGYKAGAQFDAAECIYKIFEATESLQHFQGSFFVKTKCQNQGCGSTLIRKDPFYILNIPNEILTGRDIEFQTAIMLHTSMTEIMTEYCCGKRCKDKEYIRSAQVSHSISMNCATSPLIISLGIFDSSSRLSEN